MHWDAVIEFPKMKVAVATRESTGGYLLEAKRWLLMHESSADAFELRP